ncbi:hypothetical protein DMUE_3039 [Dictyocoela muelleri]|nr:hypothetical protein DMUE_3039 [Dictyocoela muelleri]
MNFGIVDTTIFLSRGYLMIVQKRMRRLYYPYLKVIAHLTIIRSDEWAAYRSINSYMYEHGTVKHKLYFLNLITGIHTRSIESYWNKQKSRAKYIMSVAKNELKFYLSECVCEIMFLMML